MNRKLTDIELSIVCEVIASRTGLHFPVEKWAMLSRNLTLASSEFGFYDLSRFVQWLVSTNLNTDQIGILASYLTISETYFWREPHVFEALSQNIFKEYLESKKNSEKIINIWCAACATGEEAYSIAIALHRTIPEIKDWKINILATDINEKAIYDARTGIYGSWSFRNSPSWLKSSYFKRLNNMEYEVTPEIKKMVTFSSFNLAQENYLSSICKNRKMDLIFCRNVLMYFTYEWAAKVSANLSNSLSEDGWLVVSSCELSSQLFPQFTSINFPGAVLYRNGNKVSTQENSTLQLFKSSAFQPSSTLLSHLKIRQPSGAVKLPKKTIEDKTSSIRLLADQGSLKEALLICNETIETYKLSPRLYFLRASILQELDESNEAIVSLRKAIYIDPDYIMGHFTLGNLFTRIGKIKNADRYFKNVLDLLSRCAKDDILPESEGLSVKHIREIVLYNMQTQLTT